MLIAKDNDKVFLISSSVHCPEKAQCAAKQKLIW